MAAACVAFASLNRSFVIGLALRRCAKLHDSTPNKRVFPFASFSPAISRRRWPRVGEVAGMRFTRVHDSGKFCHPFFLRMRDLRP